MEKIIWDIANTWLADNPVGTLLAFGIILIIVKSIQYLFNRFSQKTIKNEQERTNTRNKIDEMQQDVKDVHTTIEHVKSITEGMETRLNGINGSISSHHNNTEIHQKDVVTRRDCEHDRTSIISSIQTLTQTVETGFINLNQRVDRILLDR